MSELWGKQMYVQIEYLRFTWILRKICIPGAYANFCAREKSVRWKSKERNKERKIKNDGRFIHGDQGDKSTIRNY